MRNDYCNISPRANPVVAEQNNGGNFMKRFFVLLLAVIMMLTVPTNAMAADVSTRTDDAILSESTVDEELVTASSTYIMATYYDTAFLSSSLYKEISLEKYCVSITYRCTTENDVYDAMHLIITDLNGGGYSKYITIEGDGQSHSMSLYLPAGNYGIQFSGELSTNHLVAAINFYGYE